MPESTEPQDKESLLTQSRFWISIALVVLSQHVITFWTIDYGADPEVISHIGFAGTILSAVLAVVAIVYAFYQSFSQRKDADSIARQIAGMQSVLASLGVTSSKMGDSADTMAKMQGHLERLLDRQEEGITSNLRIEELLKNSVPIVSAQKSAGSEDRANATMQGFCDSVLRTSGPAIAVCLAVCEIAKRDGTIGQFQKLVTEVGRVANSKQELGVWQGGFAVGLLISLFASGCAQQVRVRDQKADDRKLSVDPYFEKAVAKVVEARKSNETSGNSTGLSIVGVQEAVARI